MKQYTQQLEEITLKKVKSDYVRVKISSSKDAADYIRQFYFDDIELYESFFILLINRANNTIGYAKISQGGIAGTIADISIIAKYAVSTLSSGVILAHNHPSGSLKFSEADKQLSKRAKEALKLFSIQVLDSLVLTSDNYSSMADEGII